MAPWVELVDLRQQQQQQLRHLPWEEGQLQHSYPEEGPCLLMSIRGAWIVEVSVIPLDVELWNQ